MQKLLSLFLSLFLLCSATGCGAAAVRSAEDSDIIGDAVLPENAGDALFGGSNTDMSEDATRSYDSRSTARGTIYSDGASYEQMLQDGRVHDTNGILTDGENTH